ncbi:hypothetical protein ASE74_21675 [Pedobacter sp. Leaf216]|uniref:hypothetical protein n=1 Tax=Pedobacter sp. Leaf216 TaxID=1735684 RepID=UPI0006F22EA0|nr:hypothetical protein [Pedobacter sp. Leaf216]KQM72912.1 hypothetical protein ASE74_21675 [Pedobacter sp. Leaf216]
MKNLFTRIKIGSPALYYCGLGHLILFLLMLLIALFDHRQLMGINLWIKPIKFAISIAIYCLTWPLFLQYFPFERLKKYFANFTVFAMCFEMIAIATQAARGELSHYNITSTYNALVFGTMGIVIVSQTLFALLIGLTFFKVKAVAINPALLWSIRLGIIMTAVFAMEGGIMASRLAHTVGAADGGVGIPLLNWSKVAGDLRIAHFMGLHALQVVPLFVWLTKVKTARSAVLFSVIYFFLISFLFYNALMGNPLL